MSGFKSLLSHEMCRMNSRKLHKSFSLLKHVSQELAVEQVKIRTIRTSYYLDSHQYLLLVRGEVVTLSQEDFSEGSLSQLSLQHNVVSLNVLNNC